MWKDGVYDEVARGEGKLDDAFVDRSGGQVEDEEDVSPTGTDVRPLGLDQLRHTAYHHFLYICAHTRDVVQNVHKRSVGQYKQFCNKIGLPIAYKW